MYIIHINHEYFLSEYLEDTIAFSTNYTKALSYEKIGDAMRVAGEINMKLHAPVSKVLRLTLEDSFDDNNK